MRTDLYSLIADSMNAKMFGRGNNGAVYKFSDERFDNLLIKLDCEFGIPTKALTRFREDMILNVVANEMPGRNFGQAIFEINEKNFKLEILIRAGTCLGNLYKQELLQLSAHNTENLPINVLKELSYRSVTEMIRNMPDEAWAKKIDDIRFLASVNRLVDTTGENNITINGNSFHFIDTHHLANSPGHLESSGGELFYNLKNIESVITHRFSDIDWREAGRDLRQYLEEFKGYVTDKLLTANGGKELVKVETTKNPKTEISQIGDISVAISADKFLEKANSLREEYGLLF